MSDRDYEIKFIGEPPKDPEKYLQRVEAEIRAVAGVVSEQEEPAPAERKGGEK